MKEKEKKKVLPKSQKKSKSAELSFCPYYDGLLQ